MMIPSLVPSLSETQLTNAVTNDDSDSFYTKLAELLKSSGLSLIVNVRESLLDLYLLYLEGDKKRRISPGTEDGIEKRVLLQAPSISNGKKKKKRPYVEESKKYKEESKEAMITRKRPSVSGETGDYCVTSKPEVESVVTRAALDIALEMAVKASKDPLFLLDWDSYGSLDYPPGEYK